MPKSLHATEQQVQSAIVDWLHLMLPHHIVIHIPNSPFIHARGFVTGAPDLVIIAPGGEAGFIEVKSETGKLGTKQLAFRVLCLHNDIKWALCRSIDDVEKILDTWNWRKIP